MRKLGEGQTVFDAEGNVRPMPKREWRVNIDYPTRYLCPFCLAEGNVADFWILKKDGTPSQKCKCFECGVNFYLVSLRTELTLVQYAEWIATYPAFMFWARCSYDVWRKRLSQLGDTRPFWEAYHKAKSEAGWIPR